MTGAAQAASLLVVVVLAAVQAEEDRAVAARRVVDQAVAEVQEAAALAEDHLEADHLVVGLLVAVRPTASSSAHSSPKPTAAEPKSNHSPQATY